MAMASSKLTTNHTEIQQWVEKRGGFPAHVKRTGFKADELGVLRIDFPGFSGEDTLERVEWDAWFKAFDAKELAFLHHDQTIDGQTSRFSKLISRNSSKSRHH
jgi:hypothetical protein